MIDIPDVRGQSKYQVRFDWGAEGVAAVARDADVIVWVDALPARTATSLSPFPGSGLVLAADLTDRSAVAERVLDEQVRLARRCIVAVIAAGTAVADSGSAATAAAATTTDAGHERPPRFAVEDLLAAGAVVDALAVLGIDYCSPEVAAACAAFTGLRGAVAHLLTASVSAQELVAAGAAPSDVALHGRVDAVRDVRVLQQ